MLLEQMHVALGEPEMELLLNQHIACGHVPATWLDSHAINHPSKTKTSFNSLPISFNVLLITVQRFPNM